MEDNEKKDEDVKKEKEKKRIKYPPPEDGSFIIKDSCPQFREVTYPEPTGGETMIKRDLDTHRVQLKQIRNVPNIKLSVPEDVVKFVREMEDYDRERFKVIYLDNKNRVIGIENISEGTINAALIHPREAVKGAVLANAAGVMLIHNHPSGIPEPSKEDDNIRSKLTEGFRLLAIDVIDVLIIGKEGYYSYKEAGRMPGKAIEIIEGVMETKKVDEKCDIAMKAAMSTIKDYCGDDVAQMAVMERGNKFGFSPCYLLLSSVAGQIEIDYLSQHGGRYQYDGAHTKVSKKEGDILSCEGQVAFVYRESGDVDYSAFNQLLKSVIRDVDIKTVILSQNDDIEIKREHLTIIGIVLNAIEYTPHFYDQDEGKVTISLSIKARPGADAIKQEIDKERREQRMSSEKMWDEKP